MKYKIVVLIFLYFSGFVIKAQTVQTTTHKLVWEEHVKWYLDSTSVNVISFVGAKYPMNDRLPYFNQRIVCDKAFSYQAVLENPLYIPLTSEENLIIAGNSIPTEATVQTTILSERGSNYFDINISPFINREGQILKLSSFDLQINETKLPQKVSSSSSSLHTYATSSVLASGRFVKIKVTNSGIYKLTYEDLNSMGIDPANVRIFGYGGGILEQNFSLSKIDDLPEDAIWMEKGSDGIFNAGDYILFYAQGVNRWAYDTSKSMFTHYANYYSKYGYYFVTSDVGTGKKITEKSIDIPQSATINNVDEFTDYQVHEKDLVNILQSGKEFYGETFNSILSLDIPLSFPNPVSTNTTKVRLDVATNSTVNTSFGLSLNNSQTKVISVSSKSSDGYTMATGASGTYLFTPGSDQFSFNLTYNKSTSSSSIGYLNYLEVNVRRQLKMYSSMMQFQNVDYLGTGSYNQYTLSNATSNDLIWDITDPANISKMVTTLSSGKLTFTDSGNEVKKYIAIDPTDASSFSKPEIGSVVSNQNLHALSAVDMVIITHPDFLTQANTLAEAHRENDNLTVAVVTTDQVYNEFSSGAPDATAYRWVMKMLYDRALAANNTADLPKYLLLFGRGTFDNRKLLSSSGDNFILTYQDDNSLIQTQSFVTDDYFALLDDNEGVNVLSGLMDVGVGRFPVTTSQQATDVVNKTIGYMNNSVKGKWKNQLCFLADDGDAALHMTQANEVAESVASSFPAYQINKLYLDEYVQEVSASGQSYPLAKTRFQNLLRTGLFLLNYTGHAGASGWTNESILSNADVIDLSNTHLPLWIGATCDFLQFDVQVVSAGEQVLLNSVGGGIGILSAARPVYSSQNKTLDKLVCDNLFKKSNGTESRIGDVISYAKNHVGSEINKLCYVYMGDPAVKLNYPTKYQVITTKLNNNTIFGNDTLRALTVASIQGVIADDNGNKISDYNGTLQVVVYDKAQSITTLNNEGDGALTYSDRPNTLFSGSTDIVNGAFSFTFRLPKDIKYNFGTGRINYYAQNNTTNDEAQGYFENFLIGGTDTNYTDDTDGPIVQLYLNSDSFVSGDKVNETPYFMANISDTDGINTVGSGIGHDVMLTIDNDPNQSYILNEYFQATANSYTDGTVKYMLPEMDEGEHTLTFRVWDLLNNSTSKTIDFKVVMGLTPVIFSVYNYPNPAKTQTQIVIIHDRPETILYTTVEIFDLSGRKIWSFSQSSAENVSWNLETNNGVKVKAGIYLYRVSIKTKDSEISSKTNKMMILEQ